MTYLILLSLILSLGAFFNTAEAGPQAFYADSSFRTHYSPGFPTSSSGWKIIDGAIKAIAVADDGQAICVGTDNAVWYSSGVKNNLAGWKKQAGTIATRVAAGGNVFLHIGDDKAIYCFSGTANADGSMAWKKLNGPAANVGVIDVAVNAKGKVLCVGTDNKVYYSPDLGVTWIVQAGTWATRVAIGNQGQMIHIGSNSDMYYFSGTIPASNQIPWTKIDGRAKEVAFGYDIQMVVIGMDDALYSSSGIKKGRASWKQQSGTSAIAIALSKGSTAIASSEKRQTTN